MNQKEQILKIAEDLSSLGVKPGDVLFTHSSLSSMGKVEGGCETVIRGMEEAVGGEGTLLFPAFTFDVCTKPPYYFSYENSRCCVGAIPEYFRTRRGSIRSVHPSHSVSASGKRAEELTKFHILDHTPVGEHSPLSLLPKVGGKVLMLGCGMNPNTSMHGVEELVNCPYNLTKETVTYTLDLGNGDVRKTEHYQHWFWKRWIQRYDRLEALLPEEVLRKGKVLEADCFLMDAEKMWAVAAAKMREDPHYFVDRDPENRE